jgi:fatty acid desaturase
MSVQDHSPGLPMPAAGRTNVAACLKVITLEWPTLLLGLVIYGAWAALTLGHATLPWWLLLPLGGFVTAWHASLQHEAIHGHPTGDRRLNALFAGPPLLLWLPFAIYRDSHLAHHRDEHLTDPVRDPESFYLTAAHWRAMGVAGRVFRLAANTLAGRLLIGPFIMVGGFLAGEAARSWRGDRARLAIWAGHLAWVAAIAAWLTLACGMPVWLYLACFVWPGTALGMLRAYAEHRPAPEPAHRSALIEAGPLLSLLYLNNNLHALHHARPGLPWYALPAVYEAERERLAAGNGGFVFAGYADVARHFLLRVRDHPLHPTERR